MKRRKGCQQIVTIGTTNIPHGCSVKFIIRKVGVVIMRVMRCRSMYALKVGKTVRKESGKTARAEAVPEEAR